MEDEPIWSYIGRISEIVVGIKSYGGAKEKIWSGVEYFEYFDNTI